MRRREQVVEQWLEAWRFVLRDRTLGPDDEFQTIGGTSLDAVELAWRATNLFDVKLPLSLFVEAPTVALQADWLGVNLDDRPWSPIVQLRQGGAEQTPFFCIHPIDGNVLCYTDLAAAMEPDRPFFAIQAKGLDGIEEPLRTIPEMGLSYAKTIRGVQRKGPYFLGGWSAGGVVALEVAQQLRAQGQEVALLAMLDTLYPAHGESSARRAQRERRERAELERFMLDSPEPVPEGYDEGRRVHQVTLDALTRYDPQPYPGKITMICAETQLSRMGGALESVRREMRKGPFGRARRALRRAARAERFSPLQWRSVATEGFELVPVAGNHATMIRGENASSVARIIADRLR